MCDKNFSYLRRQFYSVAVLFITIPAIFLFFLPSLSPSQIWLWVILTYITVFVELYLLQANLEKNHSPYLGYANIVTLLRGLLLVLLCGFVVVPEKTGIWAWIPAILYSGVVIADGIDGYIARTIGNTSKLGEILDMEFDALGVLIASVLAISYGRLPIWYLAVGLMRYFFVWGMWIWKKHGRPIYSLPPSSLRRILAGTHMTLIAFSLYPFDWQNFIQIVAIIAVIPFIGGFIKDWLYVIGKI